MTRDATAGPLAGIERALVIGIGASGLAAARLLAARGVTVVAVDQDPAHPAAGQLDRLGVHVELGTDPVTLLDAGVDLVVPSPGVPETAEVLRRAEDHEVPVWSEPDLGLRIAPRRVLAVTGTNGKTSTTELVTAMLRASGTAAAACGNIGRPLSEAAVDSDPGTVLVAELSSFQLRYTAGLGAEVAVLLNLAEDHLDWHRDLHSYHQAKARIWWGQHESQWAVANADDPATVQLRDSTASSRPATFSANGPVTCGVGRESDRLVLWRWDGERQDLVGLDALPSRAPHHLANTAAAATVACLAGADPAAVAEAAATFAPGAHRFEMVTHRDEVTYVNDSKATNVHAAAAALAGAGEVVWIAGGRSKGVDLSLLGRHLGRTVAAVLIGEAAAELGAVCERAGVPWHVADSIEEAVGHAAQIAPSGSTVLLSPACASFDQFHDYADRGERFRAAVRALPGGVDRQETP